jgi:transposase-like protein
MNDEPKQPDPLPCHSGDMLSEMRCPNMKSVSYSNGFERYECAVCGKHYTLDDEEMK